MKKKPAQFACLLAILILPLLATCDSPFEFENPADLDNPNYVHLLGITLDRGTITLVAGSSTSLKPTLAPANAFDKRLEWTTSNAEVAKVDTAGLVTAVAPGQAVIEVLSTSKNAICASCTVTVVDATSKEITGFVFEGLSPDIPVAIDNGNGTITVHVPYGTDRSNLVPVITHTGTGIQPASGLAGNFTGNRLYTVTAMNEDSADYTVTVSVSDALITFDAHNGTPASLTRSVPYPAIMLGEADMPPVPTRSGFTFAGWWTETNGSGTKFEGTTTISASMTVHAHWLSQAKEILSFSLLSAEATVKTGEARGTIDIPLPYGTSLGNLVATFTSSGTQVKIGTTIQISGTTANDFSSPLTYTVVAEDGSTLEYDLTIQLTTLSAKEITSFGFTIDGAPVYGTINNTAGTILVIVPFATNRNILVPAITHLGKSIDPPSGRIRDFDTPKSYTIWAFDDSSREYMVTVKIANAVISFDADGGNPSIQTYIVEPPATSTGFLPTSPSRTYYTFANWHTGRNGTGTTFDGTTIITGDTTLFAHWIPVSYSIAYQLDGSTNHADNPASYTIESATIPLQAPSRTGYDFLGWYDNESFSGAPVTQLEVGSTGDRTYHAQWAVKSYTVIFDKQSGTGGSADVTAIYDQAVPTATAPARIGFTFGGYYTAVGGSGTQFYDTSMSSLQNWNLAANTTLYAKWTANTYTVTFDQQSGSDGSNTEIATYGQAMPAATAPTRTGYTFGGYYTHISGEGTQYYSGAMASLRNWDLVENTSLYAKWTLLTYSISYILNGGTNHAGNPATYTFETLTVNLGVPTYDYHYFNGWYDNPGFTGGTITQIVQGSTGNKEFFAKWTGEPYTVTFDQQNGSGGTNSVTATYGQAMPAATAPSRTGYSFGGYYTAIAGGGTQYYSAAMASFRNWDLAEYTTLYAMWTPVTYSISYNLIGGMNHPVNPSSYTIETATVSLGVPIHNGYDFNGWYDNSGFTGSVITQIVQGSTGNKELYAKWTGKPYTVTFDKQSGSGGTNTIIATCGQAMPTATAPSRTGYTFGGYYTQAGGAGTQYYSASMVSLRNWDIATNTTLYAKWNITSPNIGLLIIVPAGRFQRDDTATNISVITQPYRMSQHEITRAQFLAIMGTDPSDTTYSTGTSDPVQRVNWYHAIAFCNKLSLAEGLTPVYTVSGVNFSTLSYAAIPITSNTTWNTATASWTNNGYRLPTEMEWMWAAMGAPADGQGGGTNITGYTKAFAGSNSNNSIGDYAWYSINSDNKTNPVGTKTANELGLYHMSGNVCEWCWDWFESPYRSGTRTDYKGATSGTHRVVRGGTFFNYASRCTVSERGGTFPNQVDRGGGFRVVACP